MEIFEDEFEFKDSKFTKFSCTGQCEMFDVLNYYILYMCLLLFIYCILYTCFGGFPSGEIDKIGRKK
jgi:hypothetical protein